MGWGDRTVDGESMGHGFRRRSVCVAVRWAIDSSMVSRKSL